MKRPISRRDFLKLAGVLPAGVAASQTFTKLGMPQPLQSGQANVLVIVFDALSAYHLSMHGYPRETMPNITRLAERAVVYHNHYAGGNFTTPGTASILTGTLPWTHRAFQSNGTVSDDFITRNIFSAFKDHYGIAYTHNPWANKILSTFGSEIDELIPWYSLFLGSQDDGFIHTLFKNDDDIASLSWTRNINIKEQGTAYSLLISHLYQLLREKHIADYRKLFPRGIPSIEASQNVFTLEDAVDWTVKRLPALPQPFLGYFHFLPPHDPYRTSQEFYGRFGQDGYAPVDKPDDSVFSQKKSKAEMLKQRTEYDEFILYADKAFNDLYMKLESLGLLENTWLVLTSDHGEMFERGIVAHGTDSMYEPVIRTPLMIFEPGRKSRTDVYTNTSAIDLLPTLLHVTGQAVPEWAEGEVLAPFAESASGSERSVYTMRSTKNGKFVPLTHASVTLTKGRYKLHYYFGYSERNISELVKLFDVESDPEELVDLSSSQKAITTELLNELKIKLDTVNQPYL
ncbi:MAG: sulfatase-like hydrolase/transferase [Anaerolineales bacterium]|nr:sulfatase-like hydrolase/transferase [Anaerolineales bacterium]